MGKLIIPERAILKSCLSRLEWWERIGVVVHYDRYNSGSIHAGRMHIRMSRNGTPDITAYIKYLQTCAIAFFEVKRQGGKQSEHQVKFMVKFNNLTNVWYSVITDPQQIDDKIEEITGFSENQMKEITL